MRGEEVAFYWGRRVVNLVVIVNPAVSLVKPIFFRDPDAHRGRLAQNMGGGELLVDSSLRFKIYLYLYLYLLVLLQFTNLKL